MVNLVPDVSFTSSFFIPYSSFSIPHPSLPHLSFSTIYLTNITYLVKNILLASLKLPEASL